MLNKDNSGKLNNCCTGSFPKMGKHFHEWEIVVHSTKEIIKHVVYNLILLARCGLAY
mgnify:CR=1